MADSKKRAKRVKPLTPVEDTARNKWRLSVPEKLSPTGKRQQLFFATKKLAEAEAERIKGMAKQWGTEGRKIKADLATDAAKAEAILKGYDITLTQLATQYAANMDSLQCYEVTIEQLIENHIKTEAERAKSVSFSELWDEFTRASRKKSDAHKRSIKDIGKRLKAVIGEELVCDLDKKKMREALESCFKSDHYFNLARRTASPAFSLAIEREWAQVNPLAEISKKDIGRIKIEVLNVNQCRKLMQSCVDHSENKKLSELLRLDCSDCLAAISIMLFSGVRPVEVSRLSWDDIDMEEGEIRVSNIKAKTDKSRNFTMPDTLRAWLDTVPATQRIGNVVPINWRRKAQAIRKVVGIEHGRDQMRKTFASMHLAHFKDVKETREIMGHEVGDTLFEHYRGLVRKKESAAFWAIRPGSTAAQLKAVS